MIFAKKFEVVIFNPGWRATNKIRKNKFYFKQVAD